MELQHVNVKVFVEGELTVNLDEIVKVFHRWVADQSMEELLIDVADYRHVPNGPGVVLVGHQADYAIDNTGGRYGLLYNRKAGLAGSNTDRLGQAFRSASHACQLLESEFSSLKFTRQEFEIFINDRALAPNTPETFAGCKDDLESFLEYALGHSDFTLTHNADPRRLFSVSVASS